MNGGVQILIAEPADNLPISVNASRLVRAYSSKDTLTTTLHVSNYGSGAISAGTNLRWQVVGSNPDGTNTTICHGSSGTPLIPQGPGTTQVASLVCALPDLGNFTHNPQPPVTLTISVILGGSSSRSSPVRDGPMIASNKWRSRLYASAADGPSPANRSVFAQEKYCDFIPVSNVRCGIPPVGTQVPRGSVFIVDYLDQAMLQWASTDGVTVIMNGNQSSHVQSDAQGPLGVALQTDNAVFKTAWWLGSPTDNNMGTVAYPALNNIAAGMTPDHWADEGWYRLIQGGKNYLLDHAPLRGNVEVLLRSIDLITLVRPKALLWQARLVRADQNSTGGTLIVSGLNLFVNRFGVSGSCPPSFPFLIAPDHPNSKCVHPPVILMSLHVLPVLLSLAHVRPLLGQIRLVLRQALVRNHRL